jgi:predicted ATPase
MAKIIIRNVGPIKEAEFDLNKVNVFMGPQSSGKSTIAKIISYCDWVEKDVATSQSLKTYQDNKTHFRDHLVNFHKIKGYFRDDSFIYYKSEVIEIKWEKQLCDIKWVDQYAYKRKKISYITSERNMITLPEIEKLEFGNINIRSFLFDWFDARKKYPIENKLSILNLDVEYYYVDNGIVKEDHISGKANDIEYDILLSNASSGLQSITPLIAMIDYLTYWIYNEDKTSFDLQENEQKVGRYLIDEKVIKPYFNKTSFTLRERIDMVGQLNEKLKANDVDVRKLYNSYRKISNNLFKTDNTQFIIEEPEQNLFPKTQRDLVYHLLEKCLTRGGNRLTFTTHSPYVLYALNNCMMGYLVKDKIPEAKKEKLNCRASFINPESVSIWQIKEGKTSKIQAKDGLIGQNYFDDNMKEVMDDFYSMINYYGQ